MLKQKVKFNLRIARIAAVSAVLASTGLYGAIAHADQFDQQIQALQQQNAANQAFSNSLAATANSYQQAIDQLQIQIDAIAQKITSIQAQIDSLQAQITQAQAQLDQQKKTLGEDIKAMYLEGQTSTLEVLASSNDISDFVNKETYRNSVQNKVKTAVDKINTLKAQLQTQQKQQQDLLADQKNQEAQAETAQNQQNSLLSYTEGQKAAYDSQIHANNSQIASLRAQQAAALRSLTNGSGNSPTGSSVVFHNLSGPEYCGGGYDYCYAGLDEWVPDNWGLHYARECVHYVADALANRGYYIPPGLFAGQGNAYQWANAASSAGAAYVDHSPSVNAVVYLPIGSLGHVAIIDAINSDGSLHVSQMNWYPGQYNTMDLTVTSNLQFIHFHQ